MRFVCSSSRCKRIWASRSRMVSMCSLCRLRRAWWLELSLSSFLMVPVAAWGWLNSRQRRSCLSTHQGVSQSWCTRARLRLALLHTTPRAWALPPACWPFRGTGLMGCLRRVSAPQFVNKLLYIKSLSQYDSSRQMPCILLQRGLSPPTLCHFTDDSRRSTQVHHKKTQASCKLRRDRMIRSQSRSLHRQQQLLNQIQGKQPLGTSWFKIRKAGHRLKVPWTPATKLTFPALSPKHISNSTCNTQTAASLRTSARTAKRCISATKHSNIKRNTFHPTPRYQMDTLETSKAS